MVKSAYSSPNTPYYTMYDLYKESHRLNARELRMEFYLEMLKNILSSLKKTSRECLVD